jgi:hypothetical protein
MWTRFTVQLFDITHEKKILNPIFLIPFCLFLMTLTVNISMPLFRVYAKAAGFGNGSVP